MKRMMIALAMLASPALAQSTATTFEFMGIHPDASMAGEITMGDTKCTIAPTGYSNCAPPIAKIGNATIFGMAASFINGRLVRLEGSTSNLSLPLLIEAFTLKYGKPTSTRTATLQNGFGATFKNEITTWRFKEGALEVNSIGDEQDECSFNFVDENNRPKPAPTTVNF